MGCDSYGITDKDGHVIGGAITCSRGTKTKPCSFCKTRPGTLLCDFELGGNLKGKTCDARMCSSCAVEFGRNKHRCPPHDRYVLATRPGSAMVLEARQVARCIAEADAWLDALIANDVDRDALAEMFPDWSNDWHVDSTSPRGHVRGVHVGNETYGELAATDSDPHVASIDSLIERSSVGAAARDVRERGIDAHLRDERRPNAGNRGTSARDARARR